MAAKVFIDGEAGTTGLQIRARLEQRRDITLLRLPVAARKDPAFMEVLVRHVRHKAYLSC